MSAKRQHYRIEGNPEGAALFALFLAAGGCSVRTRFAENAVLISVDGIDAEIDVKQETPATTIRRLRERLNEHDEELEIALLSSEFHRVA